MDVVAAIAVTIEVSGALPDGSKALWTNSSFLFPGKRRTRVFGSEAFCLSAEATVEVVAAGAITVEASRALLDGSKDFTMEGKRLLNRLLTPTLSILISGSFWI